MSTRSTGRLRFGLVAGVVGLASIVSAVLLNVLASSFSRRFDLTATGEHQLSPRSRAIASALSGGGEATIAVVGDLSGIDAASKASVRDVLERFAAESGGSASWSMIDVGRPGGQERALGLLGELAGRDAAVTRDRERVVRGVMAVCERAAADAEESLIPGVSRALTLAGDRGVTPARALAEAERMLLEMPSWPRQLREAARRAEGELARAEGGVVIPAPGAAARVMASVLGPVASALVRLEDSLRVIDAAPGGAGGSELAAAAEAIRARREFIDAASETALSIKPTGSESAAEVLRVTAAVLFVGPTRGDEPGLVRALPVEAVLGAGVGAGRADARRQAEVVIARELARLTNPKTPIVVLAGCEPLLGGRRLRMYENAKRRFASLGADVVEWDLMRDPTRPDLTGLNPSGDRPVVWVARFPDNALPATSPDDRPGIERARMMGAAMGALAREGASLLVSVGASIVPISKEPDPADAVLGLFGLRAASDRVVMREDYDGPRRMARVDVTADVSAGAIGPASAIADSIRGLPIRIPWAVPIEGSAPAEGGATIAPGWEVATAGRGAGWWLESRWRPFRQIPRAERDFVKDPPAFNENEDERGGPWCVVAAGERPGHGRAQRLVVVGSNEWLVFAESVEEMRRQGQASLEDFAAAGANVQLLESAVYWLAGQDDLVGQGAEARAVARVKPLEPGRLLILQVILIAGLPACVLLLGVLYRVATG
ncbi:MAG: hypothetical protein HRU70_14500 [Phycisphaeraceae bacterium]|nr:MAG: hypothetical protein HRU70_14500 [Phycisphaeraceae bacterium]